ncbi:MAG TPA: S46 family peptidase [Candidatus Xenobia bacterium]|nr:S46 family peptidase [Candidatus Xenobia bacterium]
MKRNAVKLLCGLWLLVLALALAADEGLWTYNNVPRQLLEQRYGFSPSDAWLDHLRLSSVRFNNGGSGSFVSPNGLVMTNHHVGSECIQELSSAEHDYMANGFYAATRAQEKKCPNLELNVLMSLADVTEQVNAGLRPEMSPAERSAAQRAAMSKLEKECAESTGLRCDIVTLYEGGAFHLYRYKKYTDVRLVFAPEAEVAAYGGDPDNFNYPRYCLDIAFFRVYENDKPARIEHYLTWNSNGVKEGDVIFVSGNPGSTGRQLTMAQLEFLRDTAYPWRIALFKSRLKALYDFSGQNAENARVARDVILSYENSLKATTGYQGGLLDADLMAKKAAAEKVMRQQVAADAALAKEYGGVWDSLAEAEKAYAGFYREYQLVEAPIGLRQSELFARARHLVRMPVEKAKPNPTRLREYRDSNLASLEQGLFSTATIYPSLETVILGQVFAEMARDLGADHPLVKQILGGETPEQAAARYVAGTKLGDVAERRRLAEGGASAVEASNDAMIQLARLVDPAARILRKRYEDEVEAVERRNGSQLAKLLFALRGTTQYPEATFTLRLSYGAVKGYNDAGRPRRWYTTFQGLYELEAGQPPYRLPKRWLDRKRLLKLDTPYNWVNTADIIGGNSGSPVVNRQGELVGIIFDGNIQQLPNRFLYTDEVARSVAVHAAGIVEALRKIYGAQALVRELRMARPAAAEKKLAAQ